MPVNHLGKIKNRLGLSPQARRSATNAKE
jgi:hypothetical protein